MINGPDVTSYILERGLPRVGIRGAGPPTRRYKEKVRHGVTGAIIKETGRILEPPR